MKVTVIGNERDLLNQS